MSSKTLSRKTFLTLGISSVTTTALGIGCGEEAADPALNTSGGVSNTASNTMGSTGTADTTGTVGSTGTVGTTGTTTTGATATTGTTGTGTTGTGTTGTSTTGTGTMGAGGTTGTGTTDGMGGGGMGGTTSGGGMGGTTGGSCMGTAIQIEHTSDVMHDHLPLSDDEQTQLAMLINQGMAAMLTLDSDGHTHTLMFTMEEAMTLMSGGTLTGKMSSTDNMHSHTYTISCG